MVKILNNTNTGGCMTKDVKYEYIDTQDLKWLNKRAIAKNKNHYLPDNILNYLVWNYNCSQRLMYIKLRSGTCNGSHVSRIEGVSLYADVKKN